MTNSSDIDHPAEIGRRLADWFGVSARDLPWRRSRTAYTTLIAEFMLQQTQVARVAERIGDFLARFPTLVSLADATEDDVLAAWQGLGYYRRARHLHAAARLIVARFDGRVPGNVADLMTLPGIGRYTAGAIASQAYGVRVPVVDGNVQRVFARLGARATPVDTPACRDDDWALATRLVSESEAPAGIVNEAIMELGATVCTPRLPKCDACPLATLCLARIEGDPGRFPDPKSRARKQTVHHHAVVICRGSRVLLEQRADTGLWARLWQTPTIETDTPIPAQAVRERLTVPLVSLEHVGDFAHATTHRDVRFTVYRGTTRIRRGSWHEMVDLPPLSNAHHRVLAYANA